MTTLSFPLNPSIGQQYVSDVGTTWTWDGKKWIVGSLAPKQYTESVAGPANVRSGQVFDILIANGSPNTTFSVAVTGPSNYSYTTTGTLDSAGNYIYTGQHFSAVGTYTYSVTFDFDNQIKTYTFTVSATPVVTPTVATTYDPLLGISLPTTPTVGQLYTLPDNTVYQWTGQKWAVYSSITPANINSATQTSAITNPYILPKATSTTLGGVVIGEGISNTDGTISVDTTALATNIESAITGIIEQAVSVPATGTRLGQVKIGSNINVTQDGTISVPVATQNSLGVVQGGTNVTIDGTGAINVPFGAGINTLESIPNVNPAGLTDGSLLVYNTAASRWNTVTNLSQENWDSGQY